MGLLNSTMLEVIIGLIFVYLLLSILCTAANEWLSTMTRRRAKMLEKGIRQLLSNQPIRGKEKDKGAFQREFYDHPLITSIMHDKKHPAYLAPRTFAAVVTDILTASKPGSIVFEDLEAGGMQLPDGEVRTSILALVQRSNKKLDVAQNSIEAWFNDSMDRVTGWYKRSTQMWTLIIALVLTLVANADTIQIVRKLWTDPVLRASVVAEATERAKKPRPTVSVEYKDEDDPTNPTVTNNEGNVLSGKERELLGQLLGWHGPWKDNVRWDSVLGWLLTMLAISMGAPFWFDMLNKISNVRFAGKSPDETSKGPDKKDAEPRA